MIDLDQIECLLSRLLLVAKQLECVVTGRKGLRNEQVEGNCKKKCKGGGSRHVVLQPS